MGLLRYSGITITVTTAFYYCHHHYYYYLHCYQFLYHLLLRLCPSKCMHVHVCIITSTHDYSNL